MIKLMLRVFASQPTFWTLYLLVGAGIAVVELVISWNKHTEYYPNLRDWFNWTVVSTLRFTFTTFTWLGKLIGNLIYFNKK